MGLPGQAALTAQLSVEDAYLLSVEWNWLKRYRTWQASRKEFVYPENSIEPELRNEETPQFEPEPESTARLEKPDGDP